MRRALHPRSSPRVRHHYHDRFPHFCGHEPTTYFIVNYEVDEDTECNEPGWDLLPLPLSPQWLAIAFYDLRELSPDTIASHLYCQRIHLRPDQLR